MSVFTHSFKHGFFHGMLNNMFGSRNLPFSWNTMSTFFTPNCAQGDFVAYPSIMTSAPLINDVNLPTFNTLSTSLYGLNTQSNLTNPFNFNSSSYMNTRPNFNNVFNWGTISSPVKAVETVGDTYVGSRNTSKGKPYSQMSDDEMRQIYGNYSRDITKLYNGTAENLDKYLKDKGVLKGKGQAFLNAQQKYGVSAVVLIAICMNESSKGTSELAKSKNNLGGIRIAGSKNFRSFNSVDECIDYMAQLLKNNYVNDSKHLTKLYQINAKYCPASDSTDKTGINSGWAKNVEFYAKQVEKLA